MSASYVESNLPERKKVKHHKDKNSSNKYKAVASMKQRLFDMFAEFKINRDEAHSFLQSVMEKTLDYKRQKSRQEVDLCRAIEEQYNSLTQA